MSRTPFLITLLSVALGSGALVALHAQDGFQPTLPRRTAPPAGVKIQADTTPVSIAPVGAPKSLKRVRKTRTVIEEMMIPVSAEETAESQAQAQAIQTLKDAKDDASREAATLQLQAALNKAFDRDLAEREKEFMEVEQRVQALRAQLEKRKAARENIVSVRLKTLIFNADGLGFPDSATAPETTIGPGHVIPKRDEFSRDDQRIPFGPAATFSVPAPFQTPKADQSKKSPPQEDQKVLPVVAPVTKVYWFFSDERPESIRADAVKEDGDGHLVLHVDVPKHYMKELWGKLKDEDFFLMADGNPFVRGRLDRGFSPTECHLRIPQDQYVTMVPGVPYRLAPAQTTGFPKCWVDENIRVVKAPFPIDPKAQRPKNSFSDSDEPTEPSKAKPELPKPQDQPSLNGPVSSSVPDSKTAETFDGKDRNSNPQGWNLKSDSKQPPAKDSPAPPAVTDSIPLKIAPVTKVYWYFSEERPKSIAESDVKRNADGHLLLHVDVPQHSMYSLWNELDKEFTLSAPGHEPVRAEADRGFWNTECYVRIPEKEFAKMVPSVSYELAPRNKSVPQWQVEKGINIVKPSSQLKSESRGAQAASEPKPLSALDQHVPEVQVSVSVPLVVAPITKVYWYFSEERPKWIRESEIQKNGDGHLLMHVEVRRDDMDPLWKKLDKEFVLTSPGKPIVRAHAEKGFWATECYLRIPAGELAKMGSGVPYELAPLEKKGLPQWWVEKSIKIVKPPELPNEKNT